MVEQDRPDREPPRTRERSSPFESDPTEDGEQVVTVSGELDAFSAPRLREHLEQVARAGHRRVVLDLDDVLFVDSSGLGALVDASKRLREAGGDLVLRSPTPAVAKVLEVTGISQVLRVET